MIITADVARQQALNFKQISGIKNSQIRALRRVEKAINRRSKKGQRQMQYPPLDKLVEEVLKRNDFIIRPIGGYDLEGWIIITW